ncbi:MAG: prolyl oligopeptidase family serine peptidase [Candidatus Poribacteria bacterium]|nr:prolyl oligopeptidase family serine peptidase [Candidatus Poribacteria bacterium]
MRNQQYIPTITDMISLPFILSLNLSTGITYNCRGKEKTPTLIQHGDADTVVPFANAQELHRGLEAQGVVVKFFRYLGIGHGVPNVAPCAARSVMSQNLK